MDNNTPTFSVNGMEIEANTYHSAVKKYAKKLLGKPSFSLLNESDTDKTYQLHDSRNTLIVVSEVVQ